ncbi:3'-5' exonuclease, partial [Planctomycetota bacterium]
YQKRAEKVTLMTLHAAKGLEFPYVFIAGCEQGLLPLNLYPGQTTDVNEERRLLYVGMTRAQHQLWLTWAKSRHFQGRNLELEKSPFLAAIENELVEHARCEYKRSIKKIDSQMMLFD